MGHKRVRHNLVTKQQHKLKSSPHNKRFQWSHMGESSKVGDNSWVSLWHSNVNDNSGSFLLSASPCPAPWSFACWLSSQTCFLMVSRWLSLSLSLIIGEEYILYWASQAAQWWRIHLPVWEAWKTWVRSLGCWEDSLEKEMAALSSSLAWRIPWME